MHSTQVSKAQLTSLQSGSILSCVVSLSVASPSSADIWASESLRTPWSLFDTKIGTRWSMHKISLQRHWHRRYEAYTVQLEIGFNKGTFLACFPTWLWQIPAPSCSKSSSCEFSRMRSREEAWNPNGCKCNIVMHGSHGSSFACNNELVHNNDCLR